MKSSILRSLGPGTQLMMLVLIMFISVFVMQITAFLVIRPVWGVNIFESLEWLSKMESEDAININKVMFIFNQLGMFLVPALIFKKLFGNPDKDFFVYERTQPYLSWIFAGLIFLAAFPFINLLHLANLQIPVSEAIQENDVESSELLAKLLGGQGLALPINLLVFSVVPAIAEEFLFRGIILRQLALATKNIHVAVWVSAAFFSLIHGEMTIFIPRFLMGAFLGYLFVWTGNIWLNVIAHFLNNVLSVAIINLVLNDQLDAKYDSLGINEGDLVYLIVSILSTAAITFYFYRKKNKKFEEFLYEHEIERIKNSYKDDDILDDED